MLINENTWQHFRIEANQIHHYGFFEDGCAVLSIKQQSDIEVFDREMLIRFLEDIREDVDGRHEDAVRNLCCDPNCERDHYWYTTNNFKIRTTIEDRGDIIDLLDRAIVANDIQ